MSEADLRSEFSALLDQLNKRPDILGMQAALEDEILDKHRALFPRSRARIQDSRTGRWAKVCKLGAKFQAEFDGICERHRAQADVVFHDDRERRVAIERRLAEIAQEIQPVPAPDLYKAHDAWASSYHTQGFGAESYAKAEAEHRAFMLRYAGVEVEIKRVEERTPSTAMPGKVHVSVRYEVWARCTELDYEIARRMPGPSPKDELQWHWNRGVNPRVLHPFLPHGLEEKLGVSFLPVRDADGRLSP